MGQKNRIFMALAVLVFITIPMIAFACIHAPGTYKGSVTERDKFAFLFHDGQNTHLIIRTTLQSSGALPGTMAWVVPFPSLPSKYEEVSNDVFQELFGLIPRYGDPSLQDILPAAAPAPATMIAPTILVHEKQIAGSYQIQPIEILSETAGEELNAWLSKNGFGTVPPGNQKHYLKKGAVFLALRVDGLKGGEAELKPLHIVYRSDIMRLPLKFSTHSGEFNVRLYTLTDQASARTVLSEFGLYVNNVSYELDASIWSKAPTVARLIGKRTGFITEFEGEGYNANRLLADWKEDPWLSPSGLGLGSEPGSDDSAATWPGYKRIGNATFVSTMPRDLWKLAIVTVALLGAFWWFFRCARALVATWISRAQTNDYWHHLSRRLMLLGLSFWVIAVALVFAKNPWGVWGQLLNYILVFLGFAGVAALILGAMMIVAVSFFVRKKST